jgi:GNAT superfamily N-acetyltransferase
LHSCIAGEVIDGFVLAMLVPAPPVYDPGGLTCSIDDFCVADPTLWNTVGMALLDEAQRLARERGAVQVVVVCGAHDEPKRRLLESRGLSIASHWYVGRLPR